MEPKTVKKQLLLPKATVVLHSSFQTGQNCMLLKNGWVHDHNSVRPTCTEGATRPFLGQNKKERLLHSPFSICLDPSSCTTAGSAQISSYGYIMHGSNECNCLATSSYSEKDQTSLTNGGRKVVGNLSFSQERYRLLLRQLEELSMSRKCNRRPKIFPPKLHSNEYSGPHSNRGYSNWESPSCSHNLQNQQTSLVNCTNSITYCNLIRTKCFTPSLYQRENGFFAPKDIPLRLHEREETRDVQERTSDSTASSGPASFEEVRGKCITNVSTDKHRNINLDLTSDDSDLSDYEKGDSTVQNCSSPVTLKLRPEAFDDDDSVLNSDLDTCTFSYPEFLPASLRSLDKAGSLLSLDSIKKLHLQDSSVAPIVSRLIQMEKMQQLTIQKEKSKMSRSRPGTAAGSMKSNHKFEILGSGGPLSENFTASESRASETWSSFFNLNYQSELSDWKISCNIRSKKKHSMKRPKTACESKKNCIKKAESSTKSVQVNRPHSSSVVTCRNQTFSSKLTGAVSTQDSSSLRTSRKLRRPRSSKKVGLSTPVFPRQTNCSVLNGSMGKLNL
nr:PREDICTED: protein FAM217A isoform X1 [Lepisosteus oculatus]